MHFKQCESEPNLNNKTEIKTTIKLVNFRQHENHIIKQSSLQLTTTKIKQIPETKS